MTKLDRSTLLVDPADVRVGTVWRLDVEWRRVQVIGFSFRGVYFHNVCGCGHPADGIERYDWKPSFLSRLIGPAAVIDRLPRPATNIGLPIECKLPSHRYRPESAVPPPGAKLLAAPAAALDPPRLQPGF